MPSSTAMLSSSLAFLDTGYYRGGLWMPEQLGRLKWFQDKQLAGQLWEQCTLLLIFPGKVSQMFIHPWVLGRRLLIPELSLKKHFWYWPYYKVLFWVFVLWLLLLLNWFLCLKAGLHYVALPCLVLPMWSHTDITLFQPLECWVIGMGDHVQLWSSFFFIIYIFICGRHICGGQRITCRNLFILFKDNIVK